MSNEDAGPTEETIPANPNAWTDWFNAEDGYAFHTASSKKGVSLL